MKRIIIMCAIIASQTIQAQSNIIKTREANNPQGQLLTMDETILSRELAPKDLNCRWADQGHIAMFQDGKWVK